MAVGKEYFELVPKLPNDAQGQIEGSLRGLDVSGSGASLGKSLFAGALKAVAALGIGKAIADTVSQSFSNYAEYEQLVGGVDTLFKESSAKVQQYAADAFRTTGLSANEYMTTVTSFSGALLRTLGSDTEEAARLSNMAIGDMSDLVAKYGLSMQTVQDTYMSLARGNYQTLDNLFGGMFAGTKTGLRDMLDYAEQYRTGLGETVSYSEDSYADIVNAIHDVSEKLEISGSAADEASTTIQGSIGMLQASWQNLLTALSNPDADISAVFKDFTESALAVIKNAIPLVGTLVKQLIMSLPDIAMELLPVLLTAVTDIVSQIAQNLVIGVATLTYEAITAVTDGASSIAGSIADGFNGFVGEVWSGIGRAVGAVSEIPGRVLGVFAGVGAWLYESGRSLIRGFVDGIWGAIDWAAGAVADCLARVRDLFPFSPAKEGPFSGKGWTLYSGMAIADSLAEGFGQRVDAVSSDIGRSLTGVRKAVTEGATARAGGVSNSTTVNVNNAQINSDAEIRRIVADTVSTLRRKGKL